MPPRLQPQHLVRQIFWLGLAAAVTGGLYVRGGRNFAGALILAGIIVFAIAFVRSATSSWHTRANFASFVNATYLELAKALISAALAVDLIVGMFYLAGYGVIDKDNDAIEATWVDHFHRPPRPVLWWPRASAAHLPRACSD
jgi:hypothetical protein